jgi:hypothetical protein
MSISFYIRPRQYVVSRAVLLDELSRQGITADPVEGDLGEEMLIRNDVGQLLIFGDPVTCVTRYHGFGMVGDLLQAIADVANAEIYSEFAQYEEPGAYPPDYVPEIPEPGSPEIIVYMSPEYRDYLESLQGMDDLELTEVQEAE